MVMVGESRRLGRFSNDRGQIFPTHLNPRMQCTMNTSRRYFTQFHDALVDWKIVVDGQENECSISETFEELTTPACRHWSQAGHGR